MGGRVGLSMLRWGYIRDLFSICYCSSLCWRLCLESSRRVCLWNCFMQMISFWNGGIVSGKVPDLISATLSWLAHPVSNLARLQLVQNTFLVFTWTVNSIWIGMWIQYAVHATTTWGLWGISDLPWTRRLPPTLEEALSAHASITATRWCTGSPARTWRSSNECKMRWSASFVHWGPVTLYQEPDRNCTGSRSNSGSFSRLLY